MQITLVSRRSKASESLKEAITDDLQKLTRYSEKISSCHVVLDTEKLLDIVEISMHAFDREIAASGKAENIGKAFDSALDKIERQLIKLNRKIKSHKPD
jgi:ribosomal subunit interface protein